MFSPPPTAAAEPPGVDERHASASKSMADVAPVTFRLADDAVLAFMGDRNVIFSERQQKIYELNDAAAYLACRLERGASYSELYEDLVDNGLEPAAATTTIRKWLPAWSRSDIAGAEIVPSSEHCWRGYSISAGPVDFTLFHDDPDLFEAMIRSFSHLVSRRRDGATDYRISRCEDFVLISRNGRMASIVTPEQTVPALKALFVNDILEAAHPSIALHAACLVRRDRALLLCGSPGAGKSTLTLALLSAGFEYGADDVTLVNPSGRVQGMPFAPAMKMGATRLIPDLKELPVHQRLDGRRLRYWPIERRPRRDWTSVRWLIKLQRRNGMPATLVRRDPVDALADIMKEAWSKSRRTSVGNFRMLKDALANARCHELFYSDLDEAVQLLKRLCRDD